MKRRKAKEKEERILAREWKAIDRTVEKAHKTLEQEIAQYLCSQRAVEKAASRRQVNWRTNQGAPRP